jgi:hypothetical protein
MQEENDCWDVDKVLPDSAKVSSGESGRNNDVSCSSEDRQSASETANVSE